MRYFQACMLVAFLGLSTLQGAETPVPRPAGPATEGEDAYVIGVREPQPLNNVDNFINTRLKEEHIDASPLCSDGEFIRRVYLDVVGVVPNLAELHAFENDKRPDKRARLIDALLGDSERYADHWEVMWGDWLREHSVGKKEGNNSGTYRAWLRAALQSNLPYDQFARKLMTASGAAADNGAVNFFLRDQMDRVETVNTVAQAFMGTRMACAQCHDHPFDKWTQDDFHGLMAYYAQTTVTKAPKKNGPQEEPRVFDRARGEYHIPADGGMAKKNARTGEIARTRFAWTPAESAPAGVKTRREELAESVIRSPRFAQVQANRLWAQLMGRGIVEPADDFRDKNPPSHPELLEWLGKELANSGFDNKHVLRLILNSATYQRSSQPTLANRSSTALFAHQAVRRMAAEQLFDSILVATGHDKGLQELPGARADNNRSAVKKADAQLLRGKKSNVDWAADLPTPARAGTFMNLFNQPPRSVLVTRRDDEGAVAQALEMLNGKTLNSAVADSDVVDDLLEKNASPRECVVTLYSATLSRRPTSAEEDVALKRIAAAKAPRRETLCDLQWALLNAREFVFIR